MNVTGLPSTTVGYTGVRRTYGAMRPAAAATSPATGSTDPTIRSSCGISQNVYHTRGDPHLHL
ncbi:hypothetical protein Psuf_007050 [Phytohabitans suffuscus]|uniref:Uncharacterized protein n=1 Tax=Phytohabitans suffuscus TaxID=624315 RepID=A0A6F8YB98_9ACTN|nr:hypothetical protein Psuf_007050 [Phytohabitans suffuscus]